MAENCSDSVWGEYGHIFAHTRGAEDAWIEAELISITPEYAILDVNPLWQSLGRVIINKGSYEEYNETGGGCRWRVYCDDTSYLTLRAKIRICFETIPDPDPEPDPDEYNNKDDCEAAGHYWYDGFCHSNPDPTPCSSKVNEVDCMSAGCAWVNGMCIDSGGEGTCADDTTQIACEASPGCVWEDGLCRGEGVIGTPVGGTFESGGETFSVREIFCERSAALVRHVNTGTTLEVVVNHLTVFIIPGGIQLYMIGVAIDATCRYFASESLKLPAEIPDEPIPDNEDGSKGVFDETTLLQKKRAKLIDTMGQEFSDTVADATIIAKDKDVWAAKKGEDWFIEIMRQLAAGHITKEEANRLINEKLIEKTVEEVITEVLIESFKIDIPGIVMAGDVEISGTAPKANAEFRIMAVRKWLGYDIFASDKLLTTVMSDDDYKFKTTVTFEEFGALTLYAMAPKEWYEIWKEDVESERNTVLVLTWTVVFAILIAVGLVLEKKYNKLGLFKKGK